MTQIVSYYCIVDVDFDFILNIYSMHSYIYLYAVHISLYMPYNTDLVLYGEARGLRKVGEATKNQRDLYKPDSKKNSCNNPGSTQVRAFTCTFFADKGKKPWRRFRRASVVWHPQNPQAPVYRNLFLIYVIWSLLMVKKKVFLRTAGLGTV